MSSVESTKISKRIERQSFRNKLLEINRNTSEKVSKHSVNVVYTSKTTIIFKTILPLITKYCDHLNEFNV